MKNNLKILSENEIGYGVLIEKDAGETKDILKKEQILKEGILDPTDEESIHRIFIDCILQKANVKNRNGRIYPKHILEREIKKYQTLIDEKNSFGECDHPDTPTISLKSDSLSHLIKKVWMEGDVVYGTLELITSKKYHTDGTITCVGDHIANLLERGYKLGISSRGLGSLKTINGQNIVQEDFELVCWDLVSSPSTPDAYLYQKIEKITEHYTNLNENKQLKLKNFLNK